MIRDWMKMLLAILLGNLIYFLLMPILPEVMAHRHFEFDLGLALDFLICVGMYVGIRKVGG